MLKIDIITLIPDIFQTYSQILPLRRALEKNIVELNIINMRDFAVDKYGSVDDKPYGGGAGMIIRVEPMYNALKSIYKTNAEGKIITEEGEHILIMSPRGTTFDQQYARNLISKNRITVLCPRYEGFDERILGLADIQSVSLGDFILSGGEIPAMAIIEATCRLAEGVIENNETLKAESFDTNLLEYPQYTRPETFLDTPVPEILLKGHHKNIENWKKDNMKPKTSKEK